MFVGALGACLVPALAATGASAPAIATAATAAAAPNLASADTRDERMSLPRSVPSEILRRGEHLLQRFARAARYSPIVLPITTVATPSSALASLGRRPCS